MKTDAVNMYSFWGFIPLLLIHLHKGLLAERIVGTFSLVTLEHGDDDKTWVHGDRTMTLISISEFSDQIS